MWSLPFGGASAVKGLRLQPAQQACLLVSIIYDNRSCKNNGKVIIGLFTPNIYISYQYVAKKYALSIVLN